MYPDTGISSKAMGVMTSDVNDIFERIAADASHLAYYNKKSTVSRCEAFTPRRVIQARSFRTN